ncbi:MAG: hypothetical protein QOE81_1044 [Verrucomicrobiota bacterium]|jgi:hypothetical protein
MTSPIALLSKWPLIRQIRGSVSATRLEGDGVRKM